jgi:hypothetical protein
MLLQRRNSRTAEASHHLFGADCIGTLEVEQSPDSAWASKWIDTLQAPQSGKAADLYDGGSLAMDSRLWAICDEQHEENLDGH